MQSTEILQETRSSHAQRALMIGLLSVLSIRLLILVVGLVSTYTAKPGDFNYVYASGTPWMAYDAAWYRRIALEGYPQMTDSGIIPPHIAYFPLLPAAAKLLMIGGVIPVNLALVLIGNVCGLVGFIFLYRWARLYLEQPVALLTLLLVATYPGAIFFCSGYTEGPFFLLCTITLWLLGKERLLAAAIVCGITSLLRPTAAGLIVVVAVWSLLDRTPMPLSRRLIRTTLIGMICVAGAMTYEGFLWQRFGHWDVYLRAESQWDERLDTLGVFPGIVKDHPASFDGLTSPDLYTNPPKVVQQAHINAVEAVKVPLSQLAMDKLRSIPAKFMTPAAWNYCLAIFIAGAIIIAFFRPNPLPWAYTLLPLVILIITVVPGKGLRLSSVARYEIVAPPLFAILAVWMWRRLPQRAIAAVLTIALILQIYYAWRFSRGLWVG